MGQAFVSDGDDSVLFHVDLLIPKLLQKIKKVPKLTGSFYEAVKA